ncbi:hypothetical protein BJ508DRAFT_335805 [Ascobolus immersus RN42]|uniref:Uncharacterized protein n=1 Tax=Ascobolus immersus RN42 TaxID=1160509 RepID=A0A3N4HDG2_ASCIM|nr:hypothetical protein BJ508DRAFT_335805 [Ascobolus immersus RN42]
MASAPPKITITLSIEPTKRDTIRVNPFGYHYAVHQAIGPALLHEFKVWANVFPQAVDIYPDNYLLEDSFHYGKFEPGTRFTNPPDEIHYARWVLRGYSLARRIDKKLFDTETKIKLAHEEEEGIWPTDYVKRSWCTLLWSAPAFIDPYDRELSTTGFTKKYWFPCREPFLEVWEEVEPERVRIEDTKVFKLIAKHYPAAVVEEEDGEALKEAIYAVDFMWYDLDDLRELGEDGWREQLKSEGRLTWDGRIIPAVLERFGKIPPTKIPAPQLKHRTERWHDSSVFDVWQNFGRASLYDPYLYAKDMAPKVLTVTLEVLDGRTVFSTSEPHLLGIVKHRIGSGLLTKLSKWASEYADVLIGSTGAAGTADAAVQLSRARGFLSGYPIVLCVFQKLREVEHTFDSNSDGDKFCWPSDLGFDNISMVWVWGRRRLKLGKLETRFLRLRMEDALRECRSVET